MGVVIERVGTGVAHVHEGEVEMVGLPAAGDEGGSRERRPHPVERALDAASLPDGEVRPPDGLHEAGSGAVALEGRKELLDGRPGRHLPTEMTAHPVRHRNEVTAHEGEILVGPPHVAGVGGGGRPQQRHGAWPAGWCEPVDLTWPPRGWCFRPSPGRPAAISKERAPARRSATSRSWSRGPRARARRSAGRRGRAPRM